MAEKFAIFCGLNSSMMYIVSLALVFTVLVLIAIVDFVLANITMFQTPFDVVLRVPFSPWKHTWEDVPFMYLVGGSFLLGVLIIVFSVVIFDAKLKLKIRALRKEVKALGKSVAEAKSMLPKEEVLMAKNAPAETEEEQADITPEDVTRSFEDTVQVGDFPIKSDMPISVESSQEGDGKFSSEEEPEKKLSEDTSTEAEVLEVEPEQRRISENTSS